MIACAILPAAILPSGTSTSGVSPARAAYAAIEAEVLPVEAQTTALAPSCSAHRDRDGHAAVLERAGRVVALDLEPHLARRSSSDSQLGLDQRRAALAAG